MGIECVSTVGSPASLKLAHPNKPYYVTITSLSNFVICGIYHIIHNGRGNSHTQALKEMSGITFEGDTVKYAGGNGECIITALCMGI